MDIDLCQTKFNKISHENSQNLFIKEKIQWKIKRVKSSSANQKSTSRSIKKGSGCIYHFDRSEGIFKSRPPDLSQLVKLPKNYLLPIEEKEFRKYSIKGDEVQITNWVNKIKSKKPYFNIEKPKKNISIKRRKKWYCWCCCYSWKVSLPLNLMFNFNN